MSDDEPTHLWQPITALSPKSIVARARTKRLATRKYNARTRRCQLAGEKSGQANVAFTHRKACVATLNLYKQETTASCYITKPCMKASTS